MSSKLLIEGKFMAKKGGAAALKIFLAETQRAQRIKCTTAAHGIKRRK
jgi:hypothetical protein